MRQMKASEEGALKGNRQKSQRGVVMQPMCTQGLGHKQQFQHVKGSLKLPALSVFTD